MTQLDKKKISKMLRSGFRYIAAEQIKELIDIELAKDESEIDTDYIDMCFELLSLEEKTNKNTIKFRPRKVALIAAVIAFVILATGIFTASAAGQKVIHFVENIFSGYTEIESDSADNDNAPEILETEYTINNVPKGFTLTQYDSSEAGVFAVWENEMHEQIVFEQSVLNFSTEMDNEKEYTKIEMNGYPAYLYGHDNQHFISFTNGEYWFNIMVPEDFKDDLIDIAKSIKIKE